MIMDFLPNYALQIAFIAVDMYLKFEKKTGRFVGHLLQMVTVISMMNKHVSFHPCMFRSLDIGVAITACQILVLKALEMIMGPFLNLVLLD